jgi:hypothetical protein
VEFYNLDAIIAVGSVWRLLQDDPDRYIHDAMKKGADLPLPAEIKAGVADVKQRNGWNRKAPDEYALPTEIWREAIERQQRYRSIKTKLAAGEVHQVNDLVTFNLNIQLNHAGIYTALQRSGLSTLPVLMGGSALLFSSPLQVHRG